MTMNLDERQADGRWTEKDRRSINAVVLVETLAWAILGLLFLFL
jgi:hypothetical protein